MGQSKKFSIESHILRKKKEINWCMRVYFAKHIVGRVKLFMCAKHTTANWTRVCQNIYASAFLKNVPFQLGWEFPHLWALMEKIELKMLFAFCRRTELQKLTANLTVASG